MEKRLLLALILSIFILALWSIMFPQPKEKLQKEETHPITQPVVQEQIRKYVKGKEVVVDTPLYRAVFSTEGGVLTSFQLKKYSEKHIREEEIERAISSSRNEELKVKLKLLKERLPSIQGVEMVSLYSYLTDTFPLSLKWQENSSLNYNIYKVDRQGNTLTFSLNKGGLRVIKKYILREDTYLIDAEVRLVNEGRDTIQSPPLVVRYGPGVGISTDIYGRGDPYHRGIALIEEVGRKKLVREVFRRSKWGGVSMRNYTGAIWGGLENKYFIAAFLPPEQPHSIVLEKDASGRLNAGLKIQMPELLPGGSVVRNFSLYLGPKQEEILEALGKDLEKSVDYGVFSSFFRIMKILRFFYRLTHNWGLAIILLTILTKIVLLPFTQKSLRSMEKMQVLQPRLKEIRLKYKDDPRRQQKELIELYRREGVNPMGGCLPMILQMPIFIALFTTLRNTIDLRGADFLWIKDLSMPDTVCYLAGIPLNPLPLIMGLTMFWQQKMTTVDPEQAKMMFFMPIMFTVLFYNFSSGLVLYWFVQNVLTIVHQYCMKMYTLRKKAS